jgi:hypothetical protein
MLDLNQRPPPCKGGKGCCRALQAIAKPAYLSRFLFCALLIVAGCCALGGVKVVSTGVGTFGLELGPVPLQGDSAPALAVLLALYGGQTLRALSHVPTRN